MIASNESLFSIFASIRSVVFSSNAPLIPNPLDSLFAQRRYNIDSWVWSNILVKLKSEPYTPRLRALEATEEYLDTFSTGFRNFELYFAPAAFNKEVVSIGDG